MENCDPDTLSGALSARVSLLRTLLSEPEALLLDEPILRLDRERCAQVCDITWSSVATLPILLVTHDEEDIPQSPRCVFWVDAC